jgi:hypothetical protein
VKYSKVAAVVAGSVMAVGAGAPAFAVGSTTTVPTSLDGGVARALGEQPLQKAVDNSAVGSGLEAVSTTADRLKGAGTGALLGKVTDALQGVAPSLLGGLPTNGLPVSGLPLGGLPLG